MFVGKWHSDSNAFPKISETFFVSFDNAPASIFLFVQCSDPKSQMFLLWHNTSLTFFQKAAATFHRVWNSCDISMRPRPQSFPYHSLLWLTALPGTFAVEHFNLKIPNSIRWCRCDVTEEIRNCWQLTFGSLAEENNSLCEKKNDLLWYDDNLIYCSIYAQHIAKFWDTVDALTMVGQRGY